MIRITIMIILITIRTLYFIIRSMIAKPVFTGVLRIADVTLQVQEQTKFLSLLPGTMYPIQSGRGIR